jgi:hypothetical protein
VEGEGGRPLRWGALGGGACCAAGKPPGAAQKPVLPSVPLACLPPLPLPLPVAATTVAVARTCHPALGRPAFLAAALTLP